MTDKIWLSEPFDLNKFWVRHLAPGTKRYNIIKKTARKTLGNIKAHRATDDAIETLTNIIIDKFVDEVRTGKVTFTANAEADAYLQTSVHGWCRSFALQAFRNEYYDPETSTMQSEVQLANALGFVKKRKRDANGKYQYSPLNRAHGGYVKPEDLTETEESDTDLLWNKNPQQEDDSFDEMYHIEKVNSFYADEYEDYDSQYEGTYYDTDDDETPVDMHFRERFGNSGIGRDDHAADSHDPFVDGFGRYVEGRKWTMLDAQALLEGDANAAAYINRAASYGQTEAATMATEEKKVVVGRNETVIEAPTFISQKIEYAVMEVARNIVDAFAETIPKGSNVGPYELQKRAEDVNDFQETLRVVVYRMFDLDLWEVLSLKERITVATVLTYQQIDQSTDKEAQEKAADLLGIQPAAMKKRWQRVRSKLSG